VFLLPTGYEDFEIAEIALWEEFGDVLTVLSR
jgi:hypothetical protein